MRQIDLADQYGFDREVPHEERGDSAGRPADFNVPADFPPNVQQELGNRFHSFGPFREICKLSHEISRQG
jgi:hypothetical protein